MLDRAATHQALGEVTIEPEQASISRAKCRVNEMGRTTRVERCGRSLLKRSFAGAGLSKPFGSREAIRCAMRGIAISLVLIGPYYGDD